jgi:sodium-coupled monocarboxylate transporter 8/12
LLIAAIFAATMSTVSAGINSLTGSALMDLGRMHESGVLGSERGKVLAARWITVFFGLITTALALAADRIGTLVEAPVRVFGLLGGPLLGVFFLAVLSKRANGNGALLGAVAGGAVALFATFVWQVSFLWVPFYASVTTYVLGAACSHLSPPPSAEQQKLVYRPGQSKRGASETT